LSLPTTEMNRTVPQPEGARKQKVALIGAPRFIRRS
jgi:hypothetical protein